MAIKRIDPGLGDRQSGMDNWTRSKNTDDNFQDLTNAASRLVGKENGQIPLAEHIKEMTAGKIINQNTGQPILIWKGTAEEHALIETKDVNTIYIVD